MKCSTVPNPARVATSGIDKWEVARRRLAIRSLTWRIFSLPNNPIKASGHLDDAFAQEILEGLFMECMEITLGGYVDYFTNLDEASQADIIRHTVMQRGRQE